MNESHTELEHDSSSVAVAETSAEAGTENTNVVIEQLKQLLYNLEKAKEEKTKLENEVSEIQNTLNEERMKIHELTTENESIQLLNKEIQTKNSEVVQELELSQQNLRLLRNEFENLTTSFVKLNVEHDDLKNRCSKAEQDLLDSNNERQILSESISDVLHANTNIVELNADIIKFSNAHRYITTSYF
jgi:chromosome segregation ATPase